MLSSRSVKSVTGAVSPLSDPARKYKKRVPSLLRISAGMAGPGASPASLAAWPGSGALTSATLGSETWANSVALRHSPTCNPRASAASPSVASVYGGAYRCKISFASKGMRYS